jgi:hypothetical protein
MRASLACTVLALALAACADPGERVGLARQAAEDPTAWKIVDVADFNGDGFADAMWSDQEGGHMAIWLMRAHSLLEAGPVITGPGPGWVAVTGSDFNGDGFADALWWNSKEQLFSVWLMRGAEVIEKGPAIPGPPGERWQTTTAGDLNGDGFADIVFYGEKHSGLAVYLMRGTCVADAGPEVPGPPGHDWIAVLTGDTNLDHMQDILWFNPSTSQMTVWLMEGTRVLEPGPLIPGPPGNGWALSYDADFNLDGMFDVLWSNVDRGSAEVWLMQATHVIEVGPEIPGPPGVGWTANAAADADGDGLGDIFWCKAGHHPSMSITTMVGDRAAVPGAVIPGPQ